MASFYAKDSGPTTWTKYYPAAKGTKQSPIDIVKSACQYDESLGDGKFTFTYKPSDCTEIRNTGASWQICVKDDAQSVMTAAHLPGTYKLKQIHAHWGSEPDNGSEHFVDGAGYAGEIHFVHYNVKYGTIEEALNHDDGLAVLGIFLKEVEDDNPDFDVLIRSLSKIRFKGNVTPLAEGFDMASLIPPILEYWTYEGSLTTPPCNECIVWTVFRSPIHISHRQLNAFRELYAVAPEDSESNPQRLINNVRPPQPVHTRCVRASFRS